jgi:glycosyltransferase involved in cell wall biosynthesis
LVPFVITGWLDQLVLSVSGPAAALGHYAVAVSLTSLAIPLVSAVGNVSFPKLASPLLPHSGAQRLQRWALLTSAGIGIALMLPVALSAGWLIPTVFGPEFRQSVALVWLLAPGGVFFACGRVCGDLLRGRGRPGAVAWAQWTSAATLVVLLAALLPVLGVYGAAIASTTAAGVALLHMVRTLTRLSAQPIHQGILVDPEGPIVRVPSPATVPNGAPKDGMRVAVLINHPIQYFAPALRLLARRTDLRPRVHYWHAATDGVQDADFGRHIRWDTDLHSGYDWWSPPTHLPAWRRRLAILRQLWRDRPRILLCFGWRAEVAQMGIIFASVTRTPLLFYGDTHPDYSASGRFERLRSLVLRGLFRVASGALSTGSANRQFYLNHGLTNERIYSGVLPADVELFSTAAEHRLPVDRPIDPERPLVLGFSGKFIPRKGVADLIEAASLLPRDVPWELWLIGDGALRRDLETLVAQHRLAERVRFLGFRNLAELPALLGTIDVMVLPSRKDYRPLVVVEAMAAGAAVVVSTATGLCGAGDVVQHDDTALVFEAGNVDALASCLRRLIDDPGLRARLAASGRARARSCGPQDFAATTAAALISATEGR